MLRKKKNIVWITSYPKSGNTWFRIFLQNLLSKSEVPASINELNESDIASSRTLFDNVSGISSSDLTEDEIRNLRPEVYRRISAESPDLLFLKVHDAWEKNSNNEPIFPEDVTKAVIYIIRNPFEVSISFAYHNNEPLKHFLRKINDDNYGLCIKPTKLFNQLKQNLLTWSQHVQSWTERSGLPVYVIRYEDMLLETYKTFSRSLDFIGLKYTKSQIETAIHNSSFEQMKNQEELVGFKVKPLNAESFFRTGSNETWKELLDEDDVKLIVGKHSKLMNQFGYLTEIESNNLI